MPLRYADEGVQKREEEDSGVVIHMEGLDQDMRTQARDRWVQR